MSEATAYRYSRASLIKDGLLAAAGLALAALPFALASPGRVAAVVFGLIGVISLVLGIRTWCRRGARFVLTGDGLGRGAAVLRWADMTGLRLRHFATRREQPGGGWMELTVSAPGRRITVDAGLDGFAAVARAAHAAALANGVALDPATVVNLRALGLHVPEGNLRQ